MIKSLLWSLFLACSWTWCIGMFLPVLFVRNWGIWGWIVFAIPNIIGAAAMGFIIRSRESSQRILTAHKPAIAFFSLITIAFHIYFIYWFVGSRLMGPWSIVIPVGAFFAFWTAGRRRPELDSRMAAIVWLISAIAFGIIAWQLGWKLQLLPALWPAHEMAWLAPVCIVGFALCPYLDATFHRALQATGDRSPMVFSLGFGVFFLVMLVFTLWYAKPVAALIHAGNAGTVATLVVLAIGCHMSIQSAFTVAVHVRELQRMQMPKNFHIAAIVILFTATLAAGFVSKVDLQRWIGIDGGEAGYWLFMSFYSLAVPGYVWMFMVPRVANPPNRRGLIILGLIFFLGAGLFWVAIVNRVMPLLAAGVALLIAARWLGGARKLPAGVS